jgi:acid phosphatase
MPKFVADGNITPDFYAVNTMQPPYQPSANKPLPGGDAAYASPKEPTTLPPQVAQHIGDLLSAKGITWAWYAGAWQATLDGKNVSPVPNFQFHHQPFNYYANMAPGTPARAARRRHERLGIHEDDRCRSSTTRHLLQAAGQSERAPDRTAWLTSPNQRRTSLRGKFPASREFAGNFSKFEPDQAKGVWLMH